MQGLWSELISKAKLPRIITIIGGGGKTSLMYYLVSLAKKMEMPAVAATTTKLSSQYRSGHSFVEMKKLADGKEMLAQVRGMHELVTLVYGPDPNSSGKMLGIPREWIDELSAGCPEMVLIVEGDGSAGKSLKGHLDYEPVIPNTSSIVIVVIGIDSVGARINVQHVHRPQRISELIGSIPDSIVTMEMITQLLFHPQGYLQHCPTRSDIIFFINKVESTYARQQAEKLARQILSHKHQNVSGVMIGSMVEDKGQWLQA